MLGPYREVSPEAPEPAPAEPARVSLAQKAADPAPLDTLADEVTVESSQLRLLRSPVPSIIASKAMQQLYRVAAQVARGKISVLIIGETGVGKEHLAQFVHEASPRASQPFMTVNCAAVTESLFESELFGHERGAFTGATASKVGLLEATGKGTIFLDEIGELSLNLQAKLLRAIETGAVRRVGGLEPRPAEARVVAATNRCLEDMVEAGSFRRDLYHRIAGILLEVPPLRTRRNEILQLADLFAEQACQDLGRAVPAFTPAAHDALLSAQWLGNIRELRNTVERAVLLAEGDLIDTHHLYLTHRSSSDGASNVVVPDPAVPSAEPADRRQQVIEALNTCAGNQTLAAAQLNISRRTLARWLDDWDLPRPRKATRGPEAATGAGSGRESD